MIFKTFDSDVDKWTSKIGIFGKSFNELGTAVNNAFKSAIDNIDNIDKNIGFWENLKNNLAPKNEYGKNWTKNSLGEIISKENIDSYIKELDPDSAKNKLKGILDFNADVKNGDKIWQDYFDTLRDGESYIVDLIKNTDDLSKLTDEDLVKANQSARKVVIAHNQALQQQTLGAKAATAATKALAIAGNMLTMWAVSKGIEFLIAKLDNAADSVADVEDRIRENQNALSGYTSKIEELTEKLKILNETDTTYLSDSDKENLETETAYIQSQIDLYELLAAAKEKALNDDYIKATSGKNEEVAIKKLWEEIGSGEWKEAAYTIDEATNNRTWYDFLLPGLSTLLGNVDDGNYIAEADKLFEEYQQLSDTYDSLQQRVIENGSSEKLEQELEETKSQMTQTAADLAECIEQIKTARDSLANSRNHDQYADTIAEWDRAIANYQKVLTDEVGADYYAEPISGIGQSAEDATEKILHLLSAQEKLAATSDGLDKLKSVYEEFEDKGFVTASTLESLPDTFKNLYGYNTFSEIVGDPTQEKDKVQQAFNDIAKQYLISQGTLSGLLNASESKIRSYIANLHQMGITNAEEVVAQALNALEQQNPLLDEAEAEYMKYLENKDTMDIKYLESLTSRNGQLARALGTPYQTDYSNWCDLLAKKSEAYNKFVERIGGSYNPSLSVTQNIQTNGKEVNSSTLQEYYTYKSAYDQATADAQRMKDALKLDLSTINTDFSGSFSSSAGSGKLETKETFDFIETALSRIEQTIDRISKRVSATYKSYRYRNSALSEELDLLKQEQQMQKEAYDAYMERANAVGLDEDTASKVRNGDMSILDTGDDNLSGQINEYKQYYEAAQECVGAVQDLRDQIAELARTRFDMITEQYDNYLSAIEHRQNTINNDIELAEAQNKIAGTSFYEALIAQENRRLSDLNAEYEKLTRAMDDAVSGGGITKGSDMWYDMKQQIDSVSESIQESNLNLIEFESSLRSVQKLIFDATESQYDNAMKLLTDEMGLIDSAVSLIETSGHLAGADYYEQLMTAAQADIDTNTEKLEELEKQFGNMEEYSDDWYDAASSINTTRSAIMDATESLIKYQNAMRELDWTIFDRTQTAITNLADEQSWLADILSFNENDLYNDNGAFTDKGLAVQGLHVLNHEIYAGQAQLYADEIRELEKELEKDPANTTLLDRYDSLIEAQHEVISNMNSEKNAVKELISAGYERLLDSISGLISRYKEALGAEKDLYDYERKIKDLTDTRDAYVKQLSAYSGDTSEETRALIQEVTQKLKEANESLIDAEYDQYISDQEKMLDNFYSSLQEWVNTRLDNIDELMNEAVKATNENASTIAGTVQTEAARIGSMLSMDEQSVLESMETEGNTDATGDGTENAAKTTIGSTIYKIQKYMSELPTKLDSLLGSGSPVSGLLKDIKDIIDQMRTAIVKTEPEISEGSYDFSDDDDDDDDDDDYEPAASPSPGGSPSASGPAPSKSNSSGNGKYSYDVTGGGGPTQHVGITASSQEDADKKIADYVDGLNEEDDDGGYDYKRRARGVYSLRHRELAWTQEAGREMILSPGRNAILTPLERGDSVLTKAETDNIYDWAKIDPSDVLSRFAFTPDIPLSLPLPDIQIPDTNVSNDIDMTITLPNVSNYTEFVDQLQRDRRFEKIVQAMTIGNALGKSSYSKLKY